MYCTNCGTRIGDVNFCPRCGTAVRRDDRDEVERGRRGSSWEAFGEARRKAEEYVRDPQRTQKLFETALSKANARRNSQEGLLDEIWEYLQLAARLVQASIRGEYTGLSGKNLLLIIAAIIYYVSPIDFIPDILPIAGLLDDVTVLAFALRSIKDELAALKQWEIEQGRSPAA